MIAQIKLENLRLTLEEINAYIAYGIDIIYDSTNYSSWSFSTKLRPSNIADDVVLTDDEKITLMYEDAVSKDSYAYRVRGDVLLVDLVNFAKTFPKVSFTVVKTFANMPGISNDNAGAALFEIAERLQEKLNELSGISHELFNSKCQVHIGGSHLLLINQLILEEDCCTDHLQGQLDKGWRIVSVNHQEARRPDYVLGRYNPDLEKGD